MGGMAAAESAKAWSSAIVTSRMRGCRSPTRVGSSVTPSALTGLFLHVLRVPRRRDGLRQVLVTAVPAPEAENARN